MTELKDNNKHVYRKPPQVHCAAALIRQCCRQSLPYVLFKWSEPSHFMTTSGKNRTCAIAFLSGRRLNKHGGVAIELVGLRNVSGQYGKSLRQLNERKT